MLLALFLLIALWIPTSFFTGVIVGRSLHLRTHDQKENH